MRCSRNRSFRLSLGTLVLIAFIGATAATPQAPSPAETKAQQLQQEGKFREAITLLEAEPELTLPGRSLLAWLYGKTDQPERAIKEYQRLVTSNPKAVDLRNNLGALLYRQKRFDEARPEFEAARALAPDSASPHFNLGLLSFEKGEYLAAAQSLREASRLDPGRATYHFTLARAYRAAFHFEAASDAIRVGLGLPSPPEAKRSARLELVLTLKQLGRYKEAEVELEKLVGSDTKDPEALFQLGRLHLAMNRHDDARSEFQQALAIQPRHRPALFMLGLVSYQHEQPTKALDSFQRLLELDPNHAEAAYHVGLLLQASSDLSGSRRMFERVLQTEPEHLGATYNLALLLRKLGQPESGELFSRFQKLSEKQERLDYVEERVRLNPTSARFFFELGQEYSRHGRPEDAIHAFQRTLELDANFAAADVALNDLLAKRH